jgi:hypothetical protein
MAHKKAPAFAAASVLTEQQKFASFVMILLTVDKRTAPNRKRSKKYKIKQEDNLARLTSGPCFYVHLVYHVQ